MKGDDTRIPTIYIEGQGIADTFYKTLKEVQEKGLNLRTQYDRKDSNNQFIDPPSKDAKVLIRIEDLFSEPRFPKVCYSEWGKYISEFLGSKNHLVVPREELLEMIHKEEDFEPTQWPYAYHQRLTTYPKSDGSTINQLELVTDKLAEDPITRRAVAITGVPEIDLFMKQDMPCLRELQFRAIEDKYGKLILNTHTIWRSRDLYKAWSDNLIGLRNLLQLEIAPMLQEKSGREVIIGPYSEVNGSLHIYGQDYSEKGMNNFFNNNPNLSDFLEESYNMQETFDSLIVDQLKELKEEQIWDFPKKSILLINKIIDAYDSKKFKP